MRPRRELEAIGNYLGYPVCCVKHFCQCIERGLNPPSTVKHGSWCGTGFVPCPRHARMIRIFGLPIFVRRFISPKRKIKTPFPEDSGLDEVLAPIE